VAPLARNAGGLPAWWFLTQHAPQFVLQRIGPKGRVVYVASRCCLIVHASRRRIPNNAVFCSYDYVSLVTHLSGERVAG